jgi:hypothetical protein
MIGNCIGLHLAEIVAWSKPNPLFSELPRARDSRETGLPQIRLLGNWFVDIECPSGITGDSSGFGWIVCGKYKKV